jgi:hypothetical protein
MNLDSGKQTCHLRNKSRQEAHVVAPKPMAQMMRPYCVQTGVADQDLEVGAGGGVGFEDGGNVLTDGVKKARH